MCDTSCVVKVYFVSTIMTHIQTKALRTGLQEFFHLYDSDLGKECDPKWRLCCFMYQDNVEAQSLVKCHSCFLSGSGLQHHFREASLFTNVNNGLSHTHPQAHPSVRRWDDHLEEFPKSFFTVLFSHYSHHTQDLSLSTDLSFIHPEAVIWPAHVDHITTTVHNSHPQS